MNITARGFEMQNYHIWVKIPNETLFRKIQNPGYINELLNYLFRT